MADFDITCDKCGEESNFDTDGDFFLPLPTRSVMAGKLPSGTGNGGIFAQSAHNDTNQ